IAQLAEGFVRARWEVVAEQFPRDLLSMTDEEIIRSLVDGQLALPLDELVSQLPPDLFASSARAIDVEGMQDVPEPFQPVLPEHVGEGMTEACPVDRSSVVSAEALPGGTPRVTGSAVTSGSSRAADTVTGEPSIAAAGAATNRPTRAGADTVTKPLSSKT